MRKLNYSKIRRSAQADLKKYERLGVKIFTEALKLQAVPNPSPLPMQKAYVDFYQAVFVDSAKKEFNRIRQDNKEKAFVPDDFFLNTWREWIKDWTLQNLGTLITAVNDNTREKIQAVLGEGVEQGLNPFQIERLLLETIPDIKRARAIARTESTRAFNEGKKKSAEDWSNQTGTNLWKLWIHGGAREPRFQHIQAQNKPIPANSFFEFTSPKIGVVQMDKPGDIKGGAAQTVNCSCVVVYVSEAYARRNFPDAFTNLPPIDRPSAPFTSPIVPTQLGAFKYATTLDEAKEVARNIIDKQTPLRVSQTDFDSQLTLNQLNRYNEQLNKLTNEYNLSPNLDKTIGIKLSYKSTEDAFGYLKRSKYDQIAEINFGHKNADNVVGPRAEIVNGFTKYAEFAKIDTKNKDLYTITHEFAHVISVNKWREAAGKYPQIDLFWDEIAEIQRRYRTEIWFLNSDDIKGLDKVFLGNYANTNENEFMAEAFTEYKLNSNPSKYALEVGKLIDKYFKK